MKWTLKLSYKHSKMIQQRTCRVSIAVIAGLTIVGISSLGIGMGAPSTTPSFVKQVQPAFMRRCGSCHDAGSQAGGLDLSRFPDEKAFRKEPRIVQRIAERIEAGQMPPAGQPRLTSEERSAILRWAGPQGKPSGVAASRAARSIPVHAASLDPTVTPLRRLTRFEYDRTIEDLVGIAFDSREEVGIQDETAENRFNNLASALDMLPTLMEQYVSAADKILDRIIGGPNGRVPDIGDSNAAQKAHDALFGPPGKVAADRESARKILAAFASRAYRRPVLATEIEPLLGLFDRAVSHGERFESAMRLPLKAVLVSPYFLFRIEPAPAGIKPGSDYPADEYTLASRLSYFLWSTLPDSELLTLAGQHRLSDPKTLEQQTVRMLADPKAGALTENFATQWLELGKLAEARPSTDFFPTFNSDLRQAMYQETTTFFDDLRKEDKSVLNLLDADYTYVNANLAVNYNLPSIQGDKMQRASLKPGDHRGGLLGMGSVLAMTSHTYRTSPTQRGKWILGVLFGTPPPPPPGVSLITDEQKKQTGGTTFRDLLAQHSRVPACAGCHQKMDPLGFALENYDAIGRWRTEQAGHPVDTSAQLPTGEKFSGVMELKQILWKRKDDFVHNLTRRLFAYAMGREVAPRDEPAVRQIVANLKQNDYKFSTLIVGIVKSEPFRTRRSIQ